MVVSWTMKYLSKHLHSLSSSTANRKLKLHCFNISLLIYPTNSFKGPLSSHSLFCSVDFKCLNFKTHSRAKRFKVYRCIEVKMFHWVNNLSLSVPFGGVLIPSNESQQIGNINQMFSSLEPRPRCCLMAGQQESV